MKEYISVKPFIDFAVQKHKGQFDKVGQPYYLHPVAVANNVEKILGENKYFNVLNINDADFILNRATIIAICHDLFEDTNTTPEDLINIGADECILDALKLLTHDKKDSYQKYVEKISENGLAVLVKLADLTHNMDIKRFAGIKKLDDHDLQRLNKYLEAYKYLIDKFNNWLEYYERHK